MCQEQCVRFVVEIISVVADSARARRVTNDESTTARTLNDFLGVSSGMSSVICKSCFKVPAGSRPGGAAAERF